MAYCDLIVVTKDHPDLLTNLLTSLNQAGVLYQDLVRVIVVNNGSAESLSGLVAHPIPQVKVVQMDKNFGWEPGLVEGLRHADAEIVGFVNDDVQLLPGGGWGLRQMLSAFRDPLVGAVGPKSNYVMGCQSLFWFPPAPSVSTLWEAPYLINFFCLVRRSALDAVGGVDVGFHNGGDDLDQSIRLRKAGYKLLVAEYAFVYHHGSVTGRTEVGAFWNSPEHLEPIQQQLIRKHGFLGWWNCVYGPVVPYLAPATKTSVPAKVEGDVVKPWIVPTGTVLELGCGNAKLVPWSIGVDRVANDDAVMQIGGVKSVATVQADLNRPLPYADESVDEIVAQHLLEHLVDTLGVLQDWYRVLSPGGRLVLTTPDERLVTGITMNPEHVHAFTPASLSRMAEAVGFKTLHAESTGNGVSLIYVGERNGVPHV